MFPLKHRLIIILLACQLSVSQACRSAHHGVIPVSDAGVKNLYRDGRVYIAGTPGERGLHSLHQQGVTQVIDLRRPEEGAADEAEAARKQGLRYVNIPMQSDTLTEQQAADFLAAMKAAGDEPVLIHCAGGNRAGGMYGLYLGASGQCTTQEALSKARQAGLKNDKLSEDLRDYLNRLPHQP